MALKGAAGRTSYNQTLQMTSNEQLLLNLVRLRYCDTPYFLNVNNITTQYSVESGASSKLVLPGFNQNNPSSLGGSLSWKSQPTILYNPLEGREYAELLLKPLDLVIIQQLIYSGWDIDRVLRLTIQSIGGIYNAPTASGPYPLQNPEYKDFYKVTGLLRSLQMKNALFVGVDTNKDNFEGFKNIVGTSLQMIFPCNEPESVELKKHFPSIKVSDGLCKIKFSLGFDRNGTIGIMPRSVLSCMYYLSLGISVPKKDNTKTIATTTFCGSKNHFEWQEVILKLIKIKSSAAKPQEPYISVRYRNRWYYIDNLDITSKRTFVLLLSLYNLQAAGGNQAGPVLTIPVG